jgi:hypothetical protein
MPKPEIDLGHRRALNEQLVDQKLVRILKMLDESSTTRACSPACLELSLARLTSSEAKRFRYEVRTL